MKYTVEAIEDYTYYSLENLIDNMYNMIINKRENDINEYLLLVAKNKKEMEIEKYFENRDNKITENDLSDIELSKYYDYVELFEMIKEFKTILEDKNIYIAIDLSNKIEQILEKIAITYHLTDDSIIHKNERLNITEKEYLAISIANDIIKDYIGRIENRGKAKILKKA